jgi:hypothetical protein
MLKVLKFTNKSKLIILLKCAPKFRILHVKFGNFSGGHIPGPPRREGATDPPAPTRSMAAPCAGARSAPPPGSADPDPHSYFNTPQIQNPV